MLTVTVPSHLRYRLQLTVAIFTSGCRISLGVRLLDHNSQRGTVTFLLNGQWSKTKIMYLVCRYVPFAFVTFEMLLAVQPALSQTCGALSRCYHLNTDIVYVWNLSHHIANTLRELL
ncbi:hypothetical protein AZE42_07054 [Rhizopogon vesiculosus]|uniref:Uncharacterized protein n=1 Tax=Rhizopogon vesiculosus TaxID=180088 RepID=A0A1J8PX06_9AGAM|nr:hypothetical protein AZE42_07054 [Rhizopogon vesiculosus]